MALISLAATAQCLLNVILVDDSISISDIAREVLTRLGSVHEIPSHKAGITSS